MFISWAAILIALVVGAQSEDECTQEVLEECVSPLRNAEFEEHDGMFPKAEFLDKYCSPLLAAMRCGINFERRCPDFPTETPEGISEGLLELVVSICDEDSELRKGYLENVDCYDENFIQIVICGATMVAITEDFAERNENRTDFQHAELEPCIGIPLITNCIIDEVASECGSDETGPLAEIAHRFSALVTEAICPAHLLPVWQEELLSYLEEEEKRKKKK